MNSTGFVALQTVATVALGACAVEFGKGNYWVGIALGVFGVGVYAAYELIPDKKPIQ